MFQTRIKSDRALTIPSTNESPYRVHSYRPQEGSHDKSQGINGLSEKNLNSSLNSARNMFLLISDCSFVSTEISGWLSLPEKDSQLPIRSTSSCSYSRASLGLLEIAWWHQILAHHSVRQAHVMRSETQLLANWRARNMVARFPSRTVIQVLLAWLIHARLAHVPLLSTAVPCIY
jgi:hypothetical protein